MSTNQHSRPTIRDELAGLRSLLDRSLNAAAPLDRPAQEPNLAEALLLVVRALTRHNELMAGLLTAVQARRPNANRGLS